MDPQKLRDELQQALEHGLDVFITDLERREAWMGMGRGWMTIGQVRQLLRERANGIAAGLAHRVSEEDEEPPGLPGDGAAYSEWK